MIGAAAAVAAPTARAEDEAPRPRPRRPVSAKKVDTEPPPVEAPPPPVSVALQLSRLQLWLDNGFGVQARELQVVLGPAFHVDNASPVRERELSLALRLFYGLSARWSLYASATALHSFRELTEDTSVADIGHDDTATGFGDVSGGVTFILMQEGERLPMIGLSGGWRLPTAPPELQYLPPRASLSGGHHTPSIALDLSRSLDSIVLFGGVALAKPLARTVEQVRLNPGIRVTTSLGSSFLLNDRLTLNQALSVTYDATFRVDGEELPVSDDVQVTPSLGYTYRIGNDTFLRQGLEFGLLGATHATVSLVLIRTGIGL